MYDAHVIWDKSVTDDVIAAYFKRKKRSHTHLTNNVEQALLELLRGAHLQQQPTDAHMQQRTLPRVLR